MTERGTDISGLKKKYRQRNEGAFPQTLELRLVKASDLKYGENPNQHAAIYFLENAKTVFELTNLQPVNQGKGGLSLTNTMDICRAMDVLKYFPAPAVAIMKHNIVAGFAKQTKDQALDLLYRLARNADRRSCFGGSAVFNRPVDMQTALAMLELYQPPESRYRMDVIAAPGFEEGVVGRIEAAAKDIRIAQFSGLERLPKFYGDETYGLLSVKEMPTGRIGVQDVYLTSIRGPESLILDPMRVTEDGKRHIIGRDPFPTELDDILTAWYLNVAGARSNGIVIVRDGISVAVGSGQVERVGAIEQAIVKAVQKAMDRAGMAYDPLLGITGHEKMMDGPLSGAVASSDAFFPFPDSVHLLGKMGVTAVVQPFGSENDALVIDAANKYAMAMPATGERCFGHF